MTVVGNNSAARTSLSVKDMSASPAVLRSLLYVNAGSAVIGSIMWWPIVLWPVAGGRLADRPHSFDQRTAELFELHDLRLLPGDHLVQFEHELVLVCQLAFDIDQSILSQGSLHHAWWGQSPFCKRALTPKLVLYVTFALR